MIHFVLALLGLSELVGMMLRFRNYAWPQSPSSESFTRQKVFFRQNIYLWLRREILKRETESLQITAKNIVIRTNCVKAKIYNTQENNT